MVQDTEIIIIKNWGVQRHKMFNILNGFSKLHLGILGLIYLSESIEMQIVVCTQHGTATAHHNSKVEYLFFRVLKIITIEQNVK